MEIGLAKQLYNLQVELLLENKYLLKGYLELFKNNYSMSVLLLE